MPTNYERYYGFTRFAIELNELDPLLKDLLPTTDARFRPDQRQECLFIHLIFGGFKVGFGWVLNFVYVFTTVWTKLWRILLAEKVFSTAIKFLLYPVEGNRKHLIGIVELWCNLWAEVGFLITSWKDRLWNVIPSCYEWKQHWLPPKSQFIVP